MTKGYLVKDCVIGHGKPDGNLGDEVSIESHGEDCFKKLVFNGAVVAEKPKPEPKKAK